MHCIVRPSGTPSLQGGPAGPLIKISLRELFCNCIREHNAVCTLLLQLRVTARWPPLKPSWWVSEGQGCPDLTVFKRTVCTACCRRPTASL